MAVTVLLAALTGVAPWGVAAAADLSPQGTAVQQDDGQQFVVEDIRLEGLQRISAGSVFNALPIRVGDIFDSRRSGELMRALFATGYFADVVLDRDGNTLVVSVVERPSIDEVVLEGNKDIPSEELLKGLKEIGLAQGRVFVPSALDAVQQELERQYFSHGKYGVKIKTSVEDLPRNRVRVKLDISEGRVARIRQINIVGNHVFSDRDLVSQFELSTPNLLTVVTGNDKYSREKLRGDLEKLRAYYQDRGYLDFSIDSTQVAITPDRREMYITINVTEGQQYTVGDVKLSGDLIVAPEELIKRVSIRPGEIFSRKKMEATSDAISDRLGDEGYAFANINPIPDVHEETAIVDLTFFIDPGKRAYVRRIEFSGNDKTRDEVLRREMRQMESAWYSAAAVERSKVRLQRLGFFEEVNVETPAVAGSGDQVDVQIDVKERPSGSISAGFGFAQSSGLLLNASIVQDNFLGTGERVAISFSDNDFSRVYSISQTNPYYTLDGVARTYSLFFRQTDAAEENLTQFDTDSLGGNVGFSIPINEFDAISLGAGLEQTSIDTNFFTPVEITSFLASEGDDTFNIFRVNAGWAHDTRDRGLFPESGGLTSISGEVALPLGDLSFYKLFLTRQEYFPLGKRRAFLLSGTLGYGDAYGSTKELPFFENFFAGGFNSVRGFRRNTLGPKTKDVFQDPFGGDTLAIGKAELFFPPPFVENAGNNFRLSTFFDVGNVFGGDDSFSVSELRYSVGVSAVWVSPFGPLNVSFALPFNDDNTDEVQRFQFNLGANF